MTHIATIRDKDIPPYPRLGEIYRMIANALNTKNKNPDVDRFAREGEFDWSRLSKLKVDIIDEPLLAYVDDKLVEFIGRYIEKLHSDYIRLVSTVALDAMSRDEVFPLLIDHYFCFQGAWLIYQFKQEFGGPEIVEYLASEHPIDFVLSWYDEAGANHLAKTAFPDQVGDQKNREMVTRWATGEQVPDIGSIKRLTDGVRKHDSTFEQAKFDNLRRWLLIARACQFLERDANLPIRIIMLRHLISGPANDIGRVLSNALQNKVSAQMSALIMPGHLLYEDLKRTAPKSKGDQAKTRKRLDEFKSLLEQHDPDGCARYHLEWLEGRWHVLSGQFENALHHYEQASELAFYRAGPEGNKVILETLVLAAQQKKRALFKWVKHRAVAHHIHGEPTGIDVVNHGEIDNVRKCFPSIFPQTCYFEEAQDKLT